MDSCNICGAEIGNKEKKCPSCGHQVTRQVVAYNANQDDTKNGSQSGRSKDTSNYVFTKDETREKNLPRGRLARLIYRFKTDEPSSTYATSIEKHWEQLDQQLDMIPATSGNHASTSLGQILLESMSTIGSLLAYYQDVVVDGAKFNNEEQQRITGMEARIQGKLRGLIAFCDATEESATTELGLTNSDLLRIRESAATILGLIKSNDQNGTSFV